MYEVLPIQGCRAPVSPQFLSLLNFPVSPFYPHFFSPPCRRPNYRSQHRSGKDMIPHWLPNQKCVGRHDQTECTATGSMCPHTAVRMISCKNLHFHEQVRIISYEKRNTQLFV